MLPMIHNLLIVDDESIIVEGLYECFQQLEQTTFDLHKAFDGEEALEVARRMRIDVLLTDIEMPGMNGLLLQEAITRLWPRCKTIFLTGYSNFQYIQTSMRNGAIDYVLKTEEDRNVIASVWKAVSLIAEEHSMDRLLHDVRGKWNQVLPVLRRDYLLELLEGEPSSPESRASRFQELQVPLQPDALLHLCVGRVDGWPDNIRPGDKSLFLYCVGNIAAEHFADFDLVFLEAPSLDRFFWIMQPKARGLSGASADRGEVRPGMEADTEAEGFVHRSLEKYILGTIDLIQGACRMVIKLPCSFVAGCHPCAWEDVFTKYNQLNFQLVRGLGLGKEILLSDGRDFAPVQGKSSAREYEVKQLAQMLERGDREHFTSLFKALCTEVQSRDGIHSGKELELFYVFTSMFIMFINRRGMLEDISTKVNMNKLLSVHEHTTWDKAVCFFQELAEKLFEREDLESSTETNAVIWKVQEYIRQHIGDDLSLTRLSEIVFLSPYYLSSLYKQQTGQGIVEFINEVKLARAKEMLSVSSKKIYEIGLELGFLSPSYFNRFFKKMERVTPQEYRNLLNE